MTKGFHFQQKIYKTQTISPIRLVLFWFLCTLSVIFIFLYIYLVNVAILHTAERQDVQEQIADINSILSEKQEKLLALKQEIKKEVALEEGFVEVEKSHFVYREENTQLSLR